MSQLEEEEEEEEEEQDDDAAAEADEEEEPLDQLNPVPSPPMNTVLPGVVGRSE
jgi:hypothetical protein